MFLIINQRENTVIEVQNIERGSVNASEQQDQRERGGGGGLQRAKKKISFRVRHIKNVPVIYTMKTVTT